MCFCARVVPRRVFFVFSVFSFFRRPVFVTAFSFCDVLYVCSLVGGVFEEKSKTFLLRFLLFFGVFGAPLCPLGPIWQNAPLVVHYNLSYPDLGSGSRALSPGLVVSAF